MPRVAWESRFGCPKSYETMLSTTTERIRTIIQEQRRGAFTKSASYRNEQVSSFYRMLPSYQITSERNSAWNAYDCLPSWTCWWMRWISDTLELWRGVARKLQSLRQEVNWNVLYLSQVVLRSLDFFGTERLDFVPPTNATMDKIHGSVGTVCR